jgi:hypothetical protein
VGEKFMTSVDYYSIMNKSHWELKTWNCNDFVATGMIRVIFSGCKIRRENLWLVVGCKYTNQRFSLLILQPEKRTLSMMVTTVQHMQTRIITKFPGFEVNQRVTPTAYELESYGTSHHFYLPLQRALSLSLFRQNTFSSKLHHSAST